MELTLVLDPPAATPTEAKAPGTDPNDNASQAFASLLAALVGGVVPQAPTPIPVETPTTAPEPPAGPVATIPVAVATVATVATPAEAPAPAPVASLPFSSPQLSRNESHGDEKPVVTPVVTDRPTGVPDATPVAAPEKPAAKAAPAHPSATPPAPVVTPDVAVQAFSSPQLSGDERHGDQNEERPPVAVHEVATAPVAAPAVPTHPTVAAPKIAAAAAPPPAPAPQGTPVEQVVKAVAPLRKLPDGTHRVVLELHPAELGTVRVELSIDSGTVHLGLHAETEGTSHLLQAALPELRSQLDAAGLVAGRVAVDSGSAGRRDGQGTWQTNAERPARRRAASASTDTVEEIDTTATPTAAYGHVDVLL